jgi:hypothetical protein
MALNLPQTADSILWLMAGDDPNQLGMKNPAFLEPAARNAANQSGLAARISQTDFQRWGTSACASHRLSVWLTIANLLVIMLTAITTAHAVAAERQVTYADMVDRLVDLKRLAVLPRHGEETLLSSSYDRASQYDDATDQYINWDANNDGNGIVRLEGNRMVLADVVGAGSIVRMWSATPGNGKVSIYLDGSSKPIVAGPFKSYFDGSLFGLDLDALTYKTVSANVAGSNNFVPITFLHSCKIVADQDWGQYYQFTFVKFPADVLVESTRFPLKEMDLAALRKVNAQLVEAKTPDAPANAVVLHQMLSLTPGQSAVAFDLQGPRLITGLRVHVALPNDSSAQQILLSQLAIRITWDQETRPAVWSPLGDFFGYFGGANSFASIVMGASSNGAFYSNWVMPFSQQAKIEFINDSDTTITLSSDITLALPDRDIGEYGRFHAKWHRDAFLPSRADRAIDWTILKVSGRGRVVGVHLHVWNPAGGWWGEGDEKFFIDGEKFPSTFGTGTEDFFGFAWSSAGTFSRALHNQILNENNAGHAVLNRWMLTDSIPFQQSFEGSIEKYFKNDRPTLYSAVAYWYQSAGGDDPYDEVPAADRIYWK